VVREITKQITKNEEEIAKAKKELSQNTARGIYDAIDKTGQLIGGYYMLSWEISKNEDKYMTYIGAISGEVEKVGSCIAVLQGTTEKYLDFDYFKEIREEREALSNAGFTAIKDAYELIMGNIGIKPAESGNIRAIKCSPYIYLQILYLYQGAPANRESLLAIDEAQGVAPEEIRLLKNINSNNVVFNMYGDVYQHIEGTKGIDSWDELKDIVDCDYYEMVENYRNASQITEYCNRVFGMNMNPINTPGKGVHELSTGSDFCSEMITQLIDTQRAGLAAILVSNDAEARSLRDKFSAYEQKFHDMTDENFSIHKYTDDEIRNMKKITCKIAGEYLGISSMD
jgi:hypothetical protein